MNLPALLLRAAAPLDRINAAIGRAGRALAGGVLAAMTLVVLCQVISRYAFNNSLSWTEELSKSLMVWTAFLVAPSAYRDGAHVAIDTFVSAVPAKLRAAINLAVTALVLWILSVFLFESLGFVARGLQSRMATLPVPTGAFYAVMPASLFAMILVGVARSLRLGAELLGGDPVAPAPAAPGQG